MHQPLVSGATQASVFSGLNAVLPLMSLDLADKTIAATTQQNIQIRQCNIITIDTKAVSHTCPLVKYASNTLGVCHPWFECG